MLKAIFANVSMQIESENLKFLKTATQNLGQ